MSLGAIDFGLIVDGAVIIVEATLHYLGSQKPRKTYPASNGSCRKVCKENDEFCSLTNHSNSLPAYSFFTGCRRENVSAQMAETVALQFWVHCCCRHVHSNDECPPFFN